MKHTKKVMSLLLTLAMALTMSLPAFADGSATGCSITAPSDNTRTYEVYQIFTGDLSNGTLSNIKWGQNGTGTQGELVDQSTLDTLTAANGKPDSETLPVVERFVNLNSTALGTVSNGSTLDVAPGYYLVKDNGPVGEGESYSLYIVKVAGSVTIEPKVSVPSVDKEIVEGANDVKTNEASIGDVVDYKITGTLPSQLDSYTNYYYVFTDTLSKGLTFKDGSVKVVIRNGSTDVDVTKYFYAKAGAYSETNGTTITVGIQDVKALNKLDGVTVDANSKVVVTYSATLNEHAVIAGNGNANDVKLTYSNNPNESGEGVVDPPENPSEPTPSHPTGDTPKSEVVTYSTSLNILKTNKAGDILPGAEFTLTGNGVNVVLVTGEAFTEDANGTYWKLKDGTYTTTAPTIADDDTDNSADYDSTTTKYANQTTVTPKGNGQTETNVVGVIASDGYVTFSGLGAGTYALSETKTPAGYNTIAPIEFTISFDAATKAFSSNNDAISIQADNTLYTNVVNTPGSLLPSTGGMGTAILYALGFALAIGAVVLLIVKRRMKTEK